jgi:hypothetical protein
VQDRAAFPKFEGTGKALPVMNDFLDVIPDAKKLLQKTEQ